MPALRLLAVLSTLLFAASAWSQPQSVGLPILVTPAVHSGIPTTVVVRAWLRVPNASAVVERVEPGGEPTTLGTLHDDGAAGDLRPADLFYGGEFVVNESKEGIVQLRVSLRFSDGGAPIHSETVRLMVLPPRAPLTAGAVDLKHVVTDPTTKAKLLGDFVHACFKPGTPYAKVETAARAAHAEVVGLFPLLENCFVLRLQTVTAEGVKRAIAQLSVRPEVKSAEPDYVLQVTD